MMKKQYKNAFILLLVLLLVLSAMLTACTSKKFSTFRPTQTVEGKTFTFASEKDKETWRKPLEKLLSNARSIDAEDYDDPTYKRLPTFNAGNECALLDVTLDGVPELIVNYGGGTAGNQTYEIYDLETGASMGYFEADGFNKWQVYYDVSANEILLMGHYILREGWNMSHNYFSRLQYHAEQNRYSEYVCFQVDIIQLDLGYSDSEHRYYVEGREVSMSEYAEAYDAFEESLVLLEDTKLIFFSWEDGKGYKDIAEKMADALLSSEQKFLLPDA